MKAKRRGSTNDPPAREYYGADIPMRVIRRYARQIAERFQPEKIILFGSRAYGTPHEDSDVDLLVVMPAADEMNQAVRIRRMTDHPFPLDLIVRTPENLSWRQEEGDWFLREVVGKGKVLYEKANRRLGTQSRKRLHRGPPSHRQPSSSA